MDLSTALPTFLITLREGVEAALVVGIVLAFLKKAHRSHLNIWVYTGVGVGIITSALLGFLLNRVVTVLEATYPQYIGIIEPTYEGVFCILAIAMLSWMLIWMTRQARLMKAQVEGVLTEALQQEKGVGWGVFSLILVAVVREGLETVLFITGSFRNGLAASLGALAGVFVAAGIGVLLFKLGVKINVRLFFQVMGIVLILIVSGLVMTAWKRIDQTMTALLLANPDATGLCFYSEQFAPVHSCILGPLVWNGTKLLPEKEFPGILFKSLFGYREYIYLVQAVSYIVFLITVSGLYLRSLNSTPPQTSNKIPIPQK